MDLSCTMPIGTIVSLGFCSVHNVLFVLEMVAAPAGWKGIDEQHADEQPGRPPPLPPPPPTFPPPVYDHMWGMHSPVY